LAGYSINDTIVIFDRIRENIRLRGRSNKEPLDALINRSCNETLSRTIITSLTVFLVLICLLVFGGEVIRDFALALTFGRCGGVLFNHLHRHADGVPVADETNPITPLTGESRPGAATPVPATKIRRFRLHARPSAVLRNLKSLMDGAAITPELEKAVESECASAARRLDTAALYETITPAQSSDWLASSWIPAEGEKKPVALTLFVSTIGVPFENELGDALARGEGLRSRLLTALGEELADQSALFVERLVTEEARHESCELEEKRIVAEPEWARSAFAALGADRVGISFDTVGHLSPRFTRVGVIPWGPPAKKKK
jgi:hypothetical protein